MKLTTNDWLKAAEDDFYAFDARYPGDLGLLPHGKPSIEEVAAFIGFCEEISYRLKQIITSTKA